MRLTCPNCGATYEVEDGVVPAGGSHVQCSACHTRWFARAPAPAERPSEDQIIARLEARAERPRPVAAPQAPEAAATVASEPPAPLVFPAPTREPSSGATPPPPPAAAVAAFPGPVPVRPPAAGAGPTASAGAAVAAPGAQAAATPLRPREPAPRAATIPAASHVRRSRFGHGFVLAVAVAAAGLAAYLRAERIVELSPALAGPMQVYVSGVDAARDWVELHLGPQRDRLLAGPAEG